MPFKDWNKKKTDWVRKSIKTLLVWCFKVELKGTYKAPLNSVIIANRTSLIDVLLLSVFLPERLTIALHPQLFKKIWVKSLFLFADVLSVDPTNSYTTKVLIKAIRSGKRCVIFPQESSHQREHSLKVYHGPSFIIQKSGASVLPACRI